MSPRSTTSPLLRAAIVNIFIITGLVMVQRSGKLTGAMIAFYVFFFVAANTLMFFTARARRRMLER
jgi:ABC-type multidrug transport system permease subunit